MNSSVPPTTAITSPTGSTPPPAGGSPERLHAAECSNHSRGQRGASRQHLRGAAALAILVAGGAAACDRASDGTGEPADPVVAFDTASVRIETAADTLQLRVEIAESTEQITHGMMERDDLAPDAGMLFIFPAPQEPSHAFYMFRTRIPLDIAYIDETGRIVSIRTMQPCDSPNPQLCPKYPAGAEFSSVLEVNAGYFAEHGVDVGDRVVRLRE